MQTTYDSDAIIIVKFQTRGDTHTNAQTGPKNIWEIHLATASWPQAIQESIFPKMLTYYSKVNEVFWLKLMRE